MKRALTIFVMLAFLIPATGCYRNLLSHNSRPAADILEENRGYNFVGLSGPARPLRADKLCPGGVASVEFYQNFGQGFITAIAIAGLIYGERTVKVTCAAGSAHNFYLDEQDRVLAHETLENEVNSAIVDDFTSAPL